MLRYTIKQPRHILFEYVYMYSTLETLLASILCCTIKGREKRERRKVGKINTDYYHWGGHFLCSCVKGTPQTFVCVLALSTLRFLSHIFFFRDKSILWGWGVEIQYIKPIYNKLKVGIWKSRVGLMAKRKCSFMGVGIPLHAGEIQTKMFSLLKDYFKTEIKISGSWRLEMRWFKADIQFRTMDKWSG